MDKILVAVDGSESSKNAAKKASKIAASLDSKVTIMTVFDTSTIELNEIQSYRPVKSIEELIEESKEKSKNKGEKILKESSVFFEERGVKTFNVIEYGDPADVICQYAEENKFSLIVVADKGLGGVKRFFLGSISDKVVRYAKTSVLVVK